MLKSETCLVNALQQPFHYNSNGNNNNNNNNNNDNNELTLYPWCAHVHKTSRVPNVFREKWRSNEEGAGSSLNLRNEAN